jgi:hypothetical protein
MHTISNMWLQVESDTQDIFDFWFKVKFWGLKSAWKYASNQYNIRIRNFKF